MKATDFLSRVYSSDDKPEISTEDIAHYVHSVMSHLPISEARLKQTRRETAKDSILKILIIIRAMVGHLFQIFPQILNAFIVSATKL